ncbi:esterase/lipase family protein [Georgenia alba]|uniref:Esterase/lipase family protein n=1 Tax=Georgenia alba TaxID=2233858 RepID=A0ABW2QBX1_9MICO
MSPLRLGVRTRDYAYALRHQARALLGPRTDPAGLLALPDAPATGHGAPVLLLPGIYETWRFLEPLARRLVAAGHPVHVVTTLGINRRPLDDAAARAADYLAEHDLTGVVLVAHSKGGLIGKALMLSPAGWRVAGMVAVATPWEGSGYARLFPPGSAVRHLSSRARRVRALSRERAVNARIVAVAPAWDPHVPGTGELPGALRCVRLAGSGHFRVLDDADLLAAVRSAVAELGHAGP